MVTANWTPGTAAKRSLYHQQMLNQTCCSEAANLTVLSDNQAWCSFPSELHCQRVHLISPQQECTKQQPKEKKTKIPGQHTWRAIWPQVTHKVTNTMLHLPRYA